MPEDQMPEYFEKGRSVIERYCESLAAAYDNEFGVGQIGIHTVERKSDKVIRVYVDLGEKRAGLVLFEVTPEGKSSIESAQKALEHCSKDCKSEDGWDRTRSNINKKDVGSTVTYRILQEIDKEIQGDNKCSEN